MIFSKQFQVNNIYIGFLTCEEIIWAVEDWAYEKYGTLVNAIQHKEKFELQFEDGAFPSVFLNMHDICETLLLNTFKRKIKFGDFVCSFIQLNSSGVQYCFIKEKYYTKQAILQLISFDPNLTIYEKLIKNNSTIKTHLDKNEFYSLIKDALYELPELNTISFLDESTMLLDFINNELINERMLIGCLTSVEYDKVNTLLNSSVMKSIQIDSCRLVNNTLYFKYIMPTILSILAHYLQTPFCQKVEFFLSSDLNLSIELF